MREAWIDITSRDAAPSKRFGQNFKIFKIACRRRASVCNLQTPIDQQISRRGSRRAKTSERQHDNDASTRSICTYVCFRGEMRLVSRRRSFTETPS